MQKNSKLKALPLHWIETNNGIILKRGCTQIKISGQGAAAAIRFVLAAAGGTGATPEDICASFAVPQRPAIERLIQRLIAKRLLVPADSAEPHTASAESPLDIFYWNFEESAARVTARLNALRLAILGVNGISRQLVSALLASGVGNFDIVDHPLLRNLRLFDEADRLNVDQWPASLQSPIAYKEWADTIESTSLDCLVATSDFGGTEPMREWNRFCVERHRHFFPVILQDLIGCVGPLVIPDETACFECLRARQNSNMNDHETQRAVESVGFEGQQVTGFHPSMASIIGDLAAFELAKFYSGALPRRNVGKMIEVNLLAGRVTPRKMLKIPRCSVCSPLNNRTATNAKKDLLAPASRPGT